MNKKKLLDVGFLAFEAVMHIYLVGYLISINAAILAIGFTVFELVMFIRLLVNHREKELVKYEFPKSCPPDIEEKRCLMHCPESKKLRK